MPSGDRGGSTTPQTARHCENATCGFQPASADCWTRLLWRWNWLSSGRMLACSQIREAVPWWRTMQCQRNDFPGRPKLIDDGLCVCTCINAQRQPKPKLSPHSITSCPGREGAWSSCCCFGEDEFLKIKVMSHVWCLSRLMFGLVYQPGSAGLVPPRKINSASSEFIILPIRRLARFELWVRLKLQEGGIPNSLFLPKVNLPSWRENQRSEVPRCRIA